MTLKKRTRNWESFSEFNEAEQSPGFLLWKVSIAWRREIEEGLATLQLTHTQFVLLASTGWMTHHGARPAQVDLAQHANLHIAMTSQVLKTLEKRGLIKRTQKKSDDRIKHISLTTAGQDLVAKAVPLVEKIDKDFFSRIMTEDQERFLIVMQNLARTPMTE